MRGRPGRYTVQPPMSLSRPDVMRGPRYFDRPPCRNPHSSPHSFDRLGPPPFTSFVFQCGPATLWGRVQSRCAIDSGGNFFNFSPSLWVKCRACAIGSAKLSNFRPR
jgi:hypothetical protein